MGDKTSSTARFGSVRPWNGLDTINRSTSKWTDGLVSWLVIFFLFFNFFKIFFNFFNFF